MVVNVVDGAGDAAAAIAANWKHLPGRANLVDPLDKCPGGAVTPRGRQRRYQLRCNRRLTRVHGGGLSPATPASTTDPSPAAASDRRTRSPTSTPPAGAAGKSCTAASTTPKHGEPNCGCAATAASGSNRPRRASPSTPSSG